jgi:hypothetical protein
MRLYRGGKPVFPIQIAFLAALSAIVAFIYSHHAEAAARKWHRSSAPGLSEVLSLNEPLDALYPSETMARITLRISFIPQSAHVCSAPYTLKIAYEATIARPELFDAKRFPYLSPGYLYFSPQHYEMRSAMWLAGLSTVINLAAPGEIVMIVDPPARSALDSVRLRLFNIDSESPIGSVFVPFCTTGKAYF